MWWVFISSELPVIFSFKVFITCIYLFKFIGGCYDVFMEIKGQFACQFSSTVLDWGAE